MKKFILFFAVSYCLILLNSCLGDDGLSFTPTDPCDLDNVEKKEGRLIGLDLLNLTKTNTFEDNLDLADDLEIEFISLHIPWTSLETSPEVLTDPNSTLFLLNQTAEDEKFLFSLTIRPIDLTGKTVPSDLENLRFNDEEMIDRFKKVIDFVFTIFEAETFLNIQIGNEIDGYDTSSEDVGFWSDYAEFLSEINSYIKSTYGDVQVGFTGTLSGLVDNPDRFNALVDEVDHLGVTYYPIKDNFDVKSPTDVDDDFDDLLDAYTGTPIYVQELGYQSSSENNSSEGKQADFYCNFFAYWDQHIDEIKSAMIVRLNDLSLEDATNSAIPYGISDEGFIEYLRTLGIRTFEGEGSEKEAFEVIKDHLDERGW